MTTSNRSPAAAQAGSISAALPTSAIEDGVAGRGSSASPRQGFVGIAREAVDVPDLQPSARPIGVHLDREAHALVHRDRKRLRTAHPAEPGGEHDPASERPAEVLAGQLGERLVRALQDALGPDVDPRPGGHLAVHHQAFPLELAEMLPGRPAADEVGIGDQHAWCPGVRPEDADGLAALDEQRLVVGEAAQLADDRLVRLPAPRRATRAAIDHEVVRVLGDLRVQVVHEHPEGRLLAPPATGQLRPSWGTNHRVRPGHSARASGSASGRMYADS